MTPREADPNGGNSGGGEAGYEEDQSTGSPHLDLTERDVVTSGTAATSEVADREGQDDAERQGDGTPRDGQRP